VSFLITGYAPFDYEAVTVSDSAKSLTESKAQAAQEAWVSVESGNIRYRLDGVAPTSTEGHLLESGSRLTLLGRGQVNGFQAIRVTSDVQMRVTYMH